jgi:hypothetical protein
MMQLIPQLIVNGQCDELHIYSDGPASQMKNCYIHTILDALRCHFSLKLITWSFFAASHGKGPVDGVGGSAKRSVWQAILSREVDSVRNAADFVNSHNDHTHRLINSCIKQ